MTTPLDANEPAGYLVGHLEEALAVDPRVNEQGLHVTVEDGCVRITGTVSTRGRRAAVDDVVGELLPGWPVRNLAAVTDFPEPSGMEAIT
ncbi:MAG TPA: BON domain-containing protein [Acidimicrobiales bacterium]|nr:BON domain-containing protein [Acidimicrobiales bacterium]